MIGRVDSKHVAGEVRTWQSGINHIRPLAEDGEHVLGDPIVPEGLAGLGVTEHEPRLVAVGQLDMLHGAGGTH